MAAPFIGGRCGRRSKSFRPGYEQLVEPLDMGRENPYHHAYIEHRDQRAYAYHFPVPTAEEDKHEEGSDAHQGSVGAYFYLTEVSVEKP